MSGDPFDSMRDAEARGFMSMYARTNNGVYLWYAYAEYRAQRLPIPEALLERLDVVAAKLKHAEGQPDIVAALEMTNSGGGPQGATRARKELRTREMVQDIYDRMSHPSANASAIFARAAKRFRTTPRQARETYRRWMERGRDPRSGADLGELTRGWGAPKKRRDS